MSDCSCERYAPAVQLHHVQVAIPPGGERLAREFWIELLGFAEIAKPPVLAARGGLWVRRDDVEIHLGIEDDFRPAAKAHPGVLVEDLDHIRRRLEAAGFETIADSLFPGHRRFYVNDPFGNRLEFLKSEA